MDLLLIDDVDIFYDKAAADVGFWRNMQELQQGLRRRNIRVVMFADDGGIRDSFDFPILDPCYGTLQQVSPIDFRHVVAFQKKRKSQHDIQLALDDSESEDLWQSFIRGGFEAFLPDKALRQQLLEITTGHVSAHHEGCTAISYAAHSVMHAMACSLCTVSHAAVTRPCLNP